MGCVLSASNPDVWPPSTVRRRLPVPLLGASKLAFSPFSGRLWHNRLSLTVFNPDVWPPSNPPRQGTVPTSVTTRRCTVFRPVLAQWVFTVFRHALAQALCFNSFQFFDHHAGTLPWRSYNSSSVKFLQSNLIGQPHDMARVQDYWPSTSAAFLKQQRQSSSLHWLRTTMHYHP